MCGIAGYIDFRGGSNVSDLLRMIETLNHRGPNDSSVLEEVYNGASVGLAHARLSILDLSPDGRQPMTWKHLSIVFNGEIYNYSEIKNELRGLNHEFHTSSDTEVILHAFEEWGEECVNRFIGMFAFVIFNKKTGIVSMLRDRTGVKPLYLYQKNNVILFSSELKAFHKHSSFSKEVDSSVLVNYFDFGYIPGHQCIYKNVEKVSPGSYYQLDIETKKIKKYVYWDSRDFYKQAKLNISYEEAKEELESLLTSAFNYRLVSDVPVGVFLSGGYDSTAVAAILQKNISTKLKTFTIGFNHGNNEAPYAAQTAKHLGVDHHEYICTTKEAQEIIPKLPYYYDEPFADSSAIPTVLVSQFAKKHVTVALSADGGDEIFSGYKRYSDVENFLNRVNRVPTSSKGLFSLASSSFGAFGSLKNSHQYNIVAKALSKSKEIEKIKVLYEGMHRMPNQLYRGLLKRYFYDLSLPFNDLGQFDFRELPMLMDYNQYLPDDILTKVDRATMSASLEGREPFLDHRILEFTAKLPMEYKREGDKGKRILKDIVHKYVPEKIMDRPKAGFSIPLTRWFQNDLRELLHDSLLSDFSTVDDYLNKQTVQKILSDFDKGKLHYKPLIWKLLMLKLWADKWK